MRRSIMTMLLAFAIAPPAQAVRFTAAPVQVQLEVPAGGSGRAQLQVANTGPEDLEVRCVAWDWWYTDEGHMFEPAGTLERGAGAWVSLRPGAFDLPAGETAEVEVLVEAPRDVDGGHFAVAWIEAIPVADPTEAVQVRTGGRIGSLLMIRIRGTGSVVLWPEEPAIEVPSATTPLAVSLPVTNQGDAHTFATLRGIVLDEAAEIVAQVEGRPLRLLPGQRRTAKATWEGTLSSGKFQFVGTLVDQDGGAEPIQIPFTIGESDSP